MVESRAGGGGGVDILGGIVGIRGGSVKFRPGIWRLPSGSAVINW